MRKGLGRLQQIRGQRRNKKNLNRRLKRNPSDLKSFGGIVNESNSGQTVKEIKAELQEIKDSGQTAEPISEVIEKLKEMKEEEDARNNS